MEEPVHVPRPEGMEAPHEAANAVAENVVEEDCAGSQPCLVSIVMLEEVAQSGEPIVVEAVPEPLIPALVQWSSERVDQRLGPGAAARGWRVESHLSTQQ